MQRLSKYFTFEELTASQTASRLWIDNIPDVEQTKNLHFLAENLDDVRELVRLPVVVSSGFRCLKLNRAKGSKDSSAHVKGLAADITCPKFGTPTQLFMAIQESNIQFDQLILEFPHRNGWVHIAFSRENPRRECLVYDGKSYTKVGK